MKSPVAETSVTRFPDGEHLDDVVATEEPLQILIDNRPIAVLMRTPGHDRSLVAGFLLSEGVIDGPDDLKRITPCPNPDREDRHNLCLVHLAEGCAPPDKVFERLSYASTSCGVCGKTSIDNLLARCDPFNAATPLPRALVAEAGERALASQTIFRATGGIHAAALLDLETFEVKGFAEDVGRHNAIDKVTGQALLDDRLPLARHALWVSGRASFEVVQKALSAGIPALICVGAPTSLAVELARTCNLTLVGFARTPERFNVYAGEVV